jgi:predicted alpha/beta-hydrolase family hydrolase
MHSPRPELTPSRALISSVVDLCRTIERKRIVGGTAHGGRGR